jgi:hypothetical protein
LGGRKKSKKRVDEYEKIGRIGTVMKKIINRLVYDTETATELGYWSNGCSVTDFHYCNETLYRTPRGRYFVYGEGGPMTEYSVSCGNNSWSGGSDIYPLNKDAAIKWCEDRDMTDVLESEFDSELREA